MKVRLIASAVSPGLVPGTTVATSMAIATRMYTLSARSRVWICQDVDGAALMFLSAIQSPRRPANRLIEKAV